MSCSSTLSLDDTRHRGYQMYADLLLMAVADHDLSTFTSTTETNQEYHGSVQGGNESLEELKPKGR